MHYVPRLTTLLFILFSLIPFMAQAEHLPEVEAADTTILVDGVQVTAIKQGVKKVIIMDGRVPHSILMELLTDEGAGPMVKGDSK